MVRVSVPLGCALPVFPCIRLIPRKSVPRLVAPSPSPSCLYAYVTGKQPLAKGDVLSPFNVKTACGRQQVVTSPRRTRFWKTSGCRATNGCCSESPKNACNTMSDSSGTSESGRAMDRAAAGAVICNDYCCIIVIRIY